VTDGELMSAALEQAELGLQAGEVPIGSVVEADGKIVSRAFWQLRNGLLAHPELVALQTANRRDVTLVTTLEPCLLCMAAAMFAFTRRVVYALESPTDGGTRIEDVWNPAVRSVAPYRFPEVTAGVERERSSRLVAKFLERHPDAPLAQWAETLV
jgi:tRNA(adenine34) deaminase